MKRIFFILCVSLFGWQAFAGEVDECLKKLEVALQKPLKEQVKNTEKSEDSENPRRGNFAYMIPALRTNIDRNDLNAAVQMLQQLSSSPFLSQESQKAAQDLISALNKEQDSREKATMEKVEQAIKHSSEAVHAAKTAADLDAVLAELGSINMGLSNRNNSETLQLARNKLQYADKFVSRWQEALAAQAAGNWKRSREIMRDLTNSELLFVPRSELLAKAQEPSKADEGKAERPFDEIVDETIAKAKSLDDVDGLIKELKRLNTPRREVNLDHFWSCVHSLEQIHKNYREFREGLGISLEVNPNINSLPTALIPLKTQLTLLVLPRCISAPEGLKPKTGEGVIEYLKRVAEEGKTRGDIALVKRAREVMNQMQRFSAWTESDSQALSKYQAALNQEAASQYMLAVVSYQDALKIGSDAVPAKLIGERLADIQKKHPEDYVKGTERSLNPPAVPYNPMMSRFPMGMPGMPSVPEATQKPEAPKLVIPPATPASAVPAPQPTSVK